MKVKVETIIQIIIILLILFLGWGFRHYYKEFKTYKQNQDNFMVDQARELQLTKKEFKKYFDDRTKQIMDSMGIKVRNITSYVQTHYTYKDSLKVTQATIYDSLKHKYDFLVKEGCWTIGGYVTPKSDSITINRRELNDTLDIFHYKAWEHRFLFIKWGRYDVAGAYSRCKGDTIKIIKNYKKR